MLLFFIGMFQNSETFLNTSYRDLLVENNTLISSPRKRSILAKGVTCNTLNIYYLMVVLRFLFRSFTPTFSLYKAALKTKQNQTQQLPSTGDGKQEQLSPEKRPFL